MRKLVFLAVFGLLALVAPQARAAVCTNANSTVSLVQGATGTVHMTVVDQNCNPVPPSQVTIIPAASGACTAGAVAASGASEISYTTDATGFVFSLVPGAPAMSTCAMWFHYVNGTVALNSEASFGVASAVSAISTTSP